MKTDHKPADALSPCPFCANDDCYVSHITGRAFCEECGAEGPWNPYFEGDWNTRADLQTARIAALEAEIATTRAQTDAVMKDRAVILAERDRTFALMMNRAEKAEAKAEMLRGVIFRTFAHHGYSDEQIYGAINAAIEVHDEARHD